MKTVIIIVAVVVIVFTGLGILDSFANRDANKVHEYAECQRRLNTGEFSYSEILALCESKHP